MKILISSCKCAWEPLANVSKSSSGLPGRLAGFFEVIRRDREQKLRIL
jgi:hypothetical protein